MAEKVEVIAELKDLISGKFKEINAQIDAMGSKLASARSSGDGFMDGITGKIMRGVVGANLLTNAVSGAKNMIIDFGKDSIMAYGRQEQFQTALTTLLYGNTQQAEALNNQLKQFALETPFELTEIQESTKQMIAYGSSAGTVVDEMRMLGDISAGVKKPLGELVYLYGTLRTQGRAYTRDINQFLSAGINLLPTLSKQMHFVQKDWKDMAEKGKISFDDVQRAFREMTGPGSQFGGMMDKQSKTLLGQASNLTDAWEQLKASLGESQSGILKETVAWATQMVQQLNAVSRATNFRNQATAGLGEHSASGKSIWNADGPLEALAAWGEKNQREAEDKDAKILFKHKKTGMQGWASKEKFAEMQAESKQGYEYAGQMSGEDIFNSFSDKIYKELSTLKGEDAQGFMNKLTDMSRQIKNSDMSNKLAISELAVISKAMFTAKGIAGLNTDKKNAKDAEGKTPKDLETLTKANKALQITVNIENLVRELTNNIGSSDEAKRMTTEGVAQALLKAVNDIYAVGQQ